MIRSNLTATQRERHKTALYAVWADMLKRARKEYNAFQKYKIQRDFPVDPSFREFAGFMLWARLEQGYVTGRDDAKQICRVDLSRDWSPENCFFSDKPELESDVEFITAGASKVTYKELVKGNWQGMSDTRLYQIWKGMVRRCTCETARDYPDYGGRGITVYEEWKKDFYAFYKWAWDHGYDTTLSLDRIDNDAGYGPDNCRWASDLEQRLNTRQYRHTYKNIRLKAVKMRALLEQIPDDAVVTIIFRQDVLPAGPIQQDDFSAVPEAQRVDAKRSK